MGAFFCLNFKQKKLKERSNISPFFSTALECCKQQGRKSANALFTALGKNRRNVFYK